MSTLIVFLAAIFGLIIGSFMNVVILRTHTKRNLNGYSHCMSCGTRLTVPDLVPVFSYLVLLGRCRHCGARISPRYFIIEAATALLFAFIVSLGLGVIPTALELLFASLLLIIFVYDVDHLIIPDEYVVALIPVGILMTLFADGSFALPPWSFIFAGAFPFVFLGGLWKISKGQWIGLGDAKLSVPLGIVVGLTQAFSLVVFAFWIGAVVSVVFLIIQKLLARGQKYLRFLRTPLTMKTEVPFAPFLIASYALVHFIHADVFALTNAAMSYCAHLFFR